MPTLRFEGREYLLAQGQSVLEALESAGCEIPHSCRAGACQACLMQSVGGVLPAPSQQGLKDTLAAQGYFLSCQCRPEQDLEIRRVADADLKVEATVVGHQPLSSQVVRIRLQPHAPISYRAGQYVTVWRDSRLGRSYSLASVPAQDGEVLELHVKRVTGGEMSNWLFDHLQPGDVLSLQGPMGSCFYLPGQEQAAMLLMGTGTGLAPLYGIARDALLSGHAGDIHLYHGAVDQTGLYLHQQLMELNEQHFNFHYHPIVMDAGSADQWVRCGRLDELALADQGKLGGWRVYLCGPEELVLRLRKKCFLAGAGMRDIHADAFVMAPH